MAVRTDITGWLSAYNAAHEKVLRGIVRGVNEVNQQTIGDAQDLCPIATGDLKASAKGMPAEVVGNRVMADNGFAVEYAAAVHENPRGIAFSTDKNPLATDKFLERAQRALAPRAVDIVNAAIREELG